ncbi:MAG TPA: putative sulfate exporter family transporter [Candidatus Binataceae bacterium]|nr:putative sulfate exporter family transporter [Candidatus Binataceae bacterium]
MSTAVPTVENSASALPGGATISPLRVELSAANSANLAARILFPLLAVATLLPFVSPGIALMVGIAFALTLGNPYPLTAARTITPLLQISVIGLGTGMNLVEVGRAGVHGFFYTVIGISLTITIGLLMGRLLRTGRDTSLLVTVGTAICGGSAIAAVAPAIRAKSHEVSVALATVFFLNAVALLIFPAIGHHFAMSQEQFGVWSALAIHDTSSVVGAAMQYGARALEIATTIKLTRALWIVPVTLVIGVIWNRGSEEASGGKAKRPWFILGFLAAAALVTWLPSLKPAGHVIFLGAQRSLVITLFLIGSGLSRSALQVVGRRPLMQGFFLWVIMGSATLGAILLGWIR